MIIDILGWDLTYDELVGWVKENNIDLDAMSGYGFGGSTKYAFRNDEDFVAFKLKFAKERNRGIGVFPPYE